MKWERIREEFGVKLWSFVRDGDFAKMRWWKREFQKWVCRIQWVEENGVWFLWERMEKLIGNSEGLGNRFVHWVKECWGSKWGHEVMSWSSNNESPSKESSIFLSCAKFDPTVESSSFLFTRSNRPKWTSGIHSIKRWWCSSHLVIQINGSKCSSPFYSING